MSAPPVDRVLGHALEPEVGPEQGRDDLAERPGAGELPALLGVVERQALDVLGRPAARRLGPAEVVVVRGDPVAVVVRVEEPLGRVALEQHEPPVGREQPGEHGGPGVEIVQPDERAAARVHEVGGSVELVRRVEDVGQDPARRRPRGGGQTRRQVEHPRAEVDADDLVRSQGPQRQRVATGGALEMDGSPAATMEVPDQLDLGTEQVRATAPDFGDGVRQPALVAFGRFVPGRAIGVVHEARVRALAGRRRPDQRGVSVIHGQCLERGRGMVQSSRSRA